MKKMELEWPGSTELSEQEMKNTEGGGWLSPLALWTALAGSLISNFGDLREGISDGTKAVPPRY
jgi:hypothetical protein